MSHVNLNIGKTKLLSPFTCRGETVPESQLLVALPRQDHFWGPLAKSFPKVISAKLYIQWILIDFEFKLYVQWFSFNFNLMRHVNLNISKTNLLTPFTCCGWTAVDF